MDNASKSAKLVNIEKVIIVINVILVVWNVKKEILKINALHVILVRDYS